MLSAKFIERFLESKIQKNQVIALGTNKTAFKVIRELALKDVIKDLNLKIVPTSVAIAELAHHYNLKLVDPCEKIDLAIDFASTVDPFFNYTKKDTESLIRDKLVMYHAKEVIVFVEKENITKRITNFPVEASKFGINQTLNALDTFGTATLRKEKNKPVKTIGQNYIIDLEVEKIYSHDDLDFRMNAIPGILETGLFVNLADKIYSVERKHIKKVADLITR